jgi:hypothetical protein
MALYAVFLALVGLPLLIATVDISRVWVRRAQLANAVEAACAAYAHAPDMDALKMGKDIELEGKARSEGFRIFAYNIPEGGTLTSMTFIVRQVGDDPDSAVITATCSGRADFRPMILAGFVSFDLRKTVTVKAKFGSTTNW